MCASRISVELNFNCLPFQERLERMEMDVQSMKEEVNAKSEELDIRLRCLHEFQMSTNQKHFAHAGENKAELRFENTFYLLPRGICYQPDSPPQSQIIELTNLVETFNLFGSTDTKY